MASLLHDAAPVAAQRHRRAPQPRLPRRPFPDPGTARPSEVTVGVLDPYFERPTIDQPSRSRREKVGLPLAAQQIVQGLVITWRCY